MQIEQSEQPIKLPKKKSKIVLFLITFIVVLIAGALLYYFYFYNATEELETMQQEQVLTEEDEIAEPIKVPRKPAEEEEPANLAVELAACDELEGFFEREKCIKEIAVTNEDETICEIMDIDPSSIHSIEFDCYTQVALAKNDPSVCETYTELKADNMPHRFKCYTEYAIQKEDNQHCDLIADDDIQEDCMRRTEVLEKYPDFDKSALNDSTWRFIAKQVNDIEYCEYITSSFDKDDCLEYFE